MLNAPVPAEERGRQIRLLALSCPSRWSPQRPVFRIDRTHERLAAVLAQSRLTVASIAWMRAKTLAAIKKRMDSSVGRTAPTYCPTVTSGYELSSYPGVARPS